VILLPISTGRRRFHGREWLADLDDRRCAGSLGRAVTCSRRSSGPPCGYLPIPSICRMEAGQSRSRSNIDLLHGCYSMSHRSPRAGIVLQRFRNGSMLARTYSMLGKPRKLVTVAIQSSKQASYGSLSPAINKVARDRMSGQRPAPGGLLPPSRQSPAGRAFSAVCLPVRQDRPSRG
jgi:hypothetical protein